jgi:phosphopantothenoylcysteine decarboxylase / phosphopantothenate---cysteine ligase
VANDVSRAGIGFESDDNAVTLLRCDAAPQVIERASKLEIARVILAACVG